jgi:hypothetical protein
MCFRANCLSFFCSSATIHTLSTAAADQVPSHLAVISKVSPVSKFSNEPFFIVASTSHKVIGQRIPSGSDLSVFVAAF